MKILFDSAFAQSTPPMPGSGDSGAATNAVVVQNSAPAGGVPQAPSTFGMLAPFAVMLGVMYFMVIRPQQKKAKEHESLLKTIKHGDEVLTQSGILGKVAGVTEKVVTVEIADGVRVRMLKNQVLSINPNLKGA